MCCQCPARLPRHAQPPRCPALPRVGRAGGPRDLRPSGDTPRKASWWCAGSEGLSPGVTALPHITLFAERQQPRRPSLVPGRGCGRQGQTGGVGGQQHVCSGDSSTCVLGDSGVCVRGTAAWFGGQQHACSFHTAQHSPEQHPLPPRTNPLPEGLRCKPTRARQLNCLVKYKWAGDFLKLEACGKPLQGG